MADTSQSKETGRDDNVHTDTDVVIVGGGISGICMAKMLIEAGIRRIAIIEKSSGFGGTWRDNRYPGCRCDIPAHLYCFSFAGNPEWTRVFPDQVEILDYLNRVAADFKLHSHARFSSAVENAEWDETRAKWTVSVRVLGEKDAEFGSSYTLRANFLISAVGQLNVPYTPQLQGLENFKGKIAHSARWNTSEDLRGKRVGIIGNGATAVQIVPELSQIVSHLTLFQRTPNWVMPRDDEVYPETTKMMLRILPFARQFYRASLMDRSEGFHQPLTHIGTEASAQLREWCLGHMRSQLPEREDLWKVLTPEYAPGCKRILISNDFYPTLLQPNVALETKGVRAITETGVETADGGHTELDFIILATGFQTSDMLQSLPVIGLGGRSLQECWKEGGVESLYGIGVDDMPNFGMLYGPNTNLAHNSIILMIEAQARYIKELVLAVVKAQEQGETLLIKPKRERVNSFNAQGQKQLSKTSFGDPKCQSWYKTEGGKVINNWWGTVVQYQMLLSKVSWSDFDLSGSGVKGFAAQDIYIGRTVEETRFKIGRSVIAGVGVVVCAVAALGFI